MSLVVVSTLDLRDGTHMSMVILEAALAPADREDPDLEAKLIEKATQAVKEMLTRLPKFKVEITGGEI